VYRAGVPTETERVSVGPGDSNSSGEVAGSLPPGAGARRFDRRPPLARPVPRGQYSFTVQVTDSGAQPQSARKAFTLSIAAPRPPPLQIATTSLPGGAVGVSYSATLAAASGVPAYTWSNIGGQLPPGFTPANATGTVDIRCPKP